jgi:Ni/Co efflux regulator RcnB
MRKNMIVALAAAVAFAVALPVASTPADAREVIIIKKKKMKHHHYDRGRHLGWYKHRHHRPADRIVIRRDFRY